MVKLYECGSCGQYHEDLSLEGKALADRVHDGDCRFDDNRYAGAEDYSERRGVLLSEIEEIPLESKQVYTCATCGSCLEGGEGETCPLCGGDTGLEFQIEELNCGGVEPDGSVLHKAIQFLGELALEGVSERREAADETPDMLGLAGELLAKDKADATLTCDVNRAEIIAAQARLFEVLAAYRELADGLGNMVGCNRLCEDDVPEDFEWLMTLLNRTGLLDQH